MKAFDYSLVKDPQYFCDNRMEAHSDHVYYRDGNEMQTAVQDGTETSFRYSLNGLWKFHYARNYKSTVQGFEKEAHANPLRKQYYEKRDDSDKLKLDSVEEDL